MVRFVAAVVLGVAGTASAANVVVNGGFETGDFSGWTQFGNTGFTEVTGGGYANTGSYGAAFGPIGSIGGVTQVLALSAGDVVNVSFALLNTGGTPNEFKFILDGQTLHSELNADAFGYITYSFSGILIGSDDPELRIETQQDPGWWGVDDVSVRVVPLPTGAGLGMAGLIGLAAFRRRAH